jgi:quercetin dioxygenase-like cupin family protein
MKSRTKTIELSHALKGMAKLNREIRYKSCFEETRFTSGLISFRPQKGLDPKQIRHDDKDVVCQVLKGHGRLRVNGRRMPLRPGTVCHIPRGTPHDFAATDSGELVLFYCLIKTA